MTPPCGPEPSSPHRATFVTRDRTGQNRAVCSAGVAGGREPPIEIVGGANQRQVRKGLRKVAEVLRPRAQLFAVESQVIGIAKHFLEEEPRLGEIAHAD